MICILPPSPERVATAPTRLAVQLSRKWEQEVVRVRFLDGDPKLHKYVADLMTGPRGWNACSGLQFRFTDEADAEVRVTFTAAGASWSQVGTDALWVQRDQPTMSLAIRLEDAGPHIDRPILHEFGHAMGFIHGQSSPWVGPLKEAEVIEWYESRGYTRSWIQRNVIERYAESDVAAIGAKVPSVMNYNIPAEFWQDGTPLLTADYPTYWDAYAAETWYGAPPVRYTSVILPFVARS